MTRIVGIKKFGHGRKPTDLGSGSVPKLLLKLSLPAVVAQIINMLYNLVDRIFVGRIEGIGTDALAGLGVCFPVILIVAAFSVLIGMGGSPLVAIKLGEKKPEEAERILNNGVVLLGILGIVLTIVIALFSEQLLTLFGSPKSSLPYGADYLQIYAIGTIFVMLSLGLNNFISAQGFALTSMATVTIGAVLNIALDPLFIYVFRMGVQGAALATVISQAVSCAWVLYFFIRKKQSRIGIKPKLFALKAKIVLPMLALGLSPFVMQATESAVQIVFNVQLFHYTGGAKEYTAALTIMMSVMQIVTLPLNGMGMGAQPLISYNYGAGKTDRIKQTVKWLTLVNFGVTAVIWTLCLSCPQIFAAIFSASGDVSEIVKSYMPIFMMGMILFCFQSSFQNSFLALGQAKVSMVLALLRKVILLIPLTFLFPLFMGVKGIFFAEGIADLTAAVVTSVTFLFTFKGILNRRVKQLTVEVGTENREVAPNEASKDCNIEKCQSELVGQPHGNSSGSEEEK